jgi:hypothetical protein
MSRRWALPALYTLLGFDRGTQEEYIDNGDQE